jgi:2-amino-4-hydroxy-6-hydroxymethyldihydropteridine diphosphokinase
MNEKEKIYLALGTNLGSRSLNLVRACSALKKFCTVTRVSHIFETPPWGVTDQPAFLNQVLEVTTDLPPLELLNTIKALEVELGRVPSVRYGPRLIDIDILLYGSQEVNTEALVIPHPRMNERAFVLVPLSELVPDLVPPGSSSSIKEMLAGLDMSGIKQYKEKHGT